jgi:hypothetical protein
MFIEAYHKLRYHQRRATEAALEPLDEPRTDLPNLGNHIRTAPERFVIGSHTRESISDTPSNTGPVVHVIIMID